ncbi:MAG: protoporphyrinogen oxidase [Bacteroidaceae bacterium]
MTNNINITTPEKHYQVIVIGAGITGLSTAINLRKEGLDVHILEQKDRIGGQIASFKEGEFVFESGPNTGVVNCPEVIELFDLSDTKLLTPNPNVKKRLIWKDKRFHQLPSNMYQGFTTSLFTWKDKFRILGEPWRKRGENPDESVADLVRRRLGKSFLDYAVNPFLSGVYAGNAETLITRYALPKLYNLEQDYGSFIGGAIKKGREPKSERDKKVTKEIFSAPDGLQTLTDNIAHKLGRESFTLGTKDCHIWPINKKGNSKDTQGENHTVMASPKWLISYIAEGQTHYISADYVVTTTGAYELKTLLPFINKEAIESFNSLRYAPVMQVAISISDIKGHGPLSYGGLIPSHSGESTLGILFPSSCYLGKAPAGGALFTAFLGGVHHPEVLKMSDKQIEKIIDHDIYEMLNLPKEITIDALHIFRHDKAIPQYEINSGERFEFIHQLEKNYQGLYLGGNMIDGIGLADRIKQGTTIAKKIIKSSSFS